MGLANIYAALEEGITIMDASLGGMGGCPFVHQSKAGNIAMEDPRRHTCFHDMGIETGYDLEMINKVRNEIRHPGNCKPPEQPLCNIMNTT